MRILTDKERDRLKIHHRAERDGRIRDRIKAVLLRDKGWSYQQIANALLVSEDGIRNHIQDYQSARKLKPENGGSKSALSRQQSKFLLKHLEGNTYLHVKSIVRYIELKWSVQYSVAGLTQWLKRNGFSYKKPKLVPGKADRELQEEWIKQYQSMKVNLPENETICFMDGVHPSHNVQLGYGWIRKGTEKLIPSNTGRSRLNLTGAIDIISHTVVIQEDPMLNAEATVRFFHKLELNQPAKAKIHVFCDNARYYRNRSVTKYLETSRIELHFLPPYSPNLNPIERLWKWMKEVVIYNTYYEEFCDFRSAVFGFFKALSGLDPGSELGHSFRTRIRDKFRAMGAPTQAAL
jgi:transposase